MSAFPEQPFDEREHRYYLAEILKLSNAPTADLVKFIQDRGIVPQWNLMALPNGRSVASCENAFNLLTNRVSSVLGPAPVPGPVPGTTVLPPFASKPKRKQRPSPGGPPSAVTGRTTQPPQYTFAPINQPSNPAAFQPAPHTPGDTPERSGKKRGRPTKAEYETRAAEAAARGEIWPPPKRQKPPKPSKESVSEGGGVEAGEAGSGSSGKKKGTRPRPAPTAPGGIQYGAPGQGTFALPTSGIAGEQMQFGVPMGQARSTIPETQPSEFAATESLLAGMHEHAARVEGAKPEAVISSVTTAPTQTETGQSTMTLQHEPALGDQPQGIPTTVTGS